MPEVMLFLSNDRGYYSTRLNGERMIYFQNRNSVCTGVGLFNTSVLFEKPNYTMVNCDSLVKTSKITLSELIHKYIETNSVINMPDIKEYILPTNQIIYEVEFGVIEFYVYKDSEGIHEIYNIDTIGIRNKTYYHQFTDGLSKYLNPNANIEYGTTDKMTEASLMKMSAVLTGYVLQSTYNFSEFIIYTDNETKVVVRTISKSEYSKSIHSSIYEIRMFNGCIIMTNFIFMNDGDSSKYTDGLTDITKTVSEFCMKHHIQIRHRPYYVGAKLHQPYTFNYETLEHDPLVDEYVKNANDAMIRLGKIGGAEAYKKIKEIIYNKYCKI